MKKLLLLYIVLTMIAGCGGLSTPNDMLTTAVTIHDAKTFEGHGSGTIIDVGPLTEDLNMVTILTALHVANAMPTPLIRIRLYDDNGDINGVVVAQGFSYSGYPTRDLATMWFTVSNKVQLKMATIAENHKFRVGEKLWLTSSPGGSYPLLSEGIFGGWSSSSLFFSSPGGYYTGGVSPGSSGGGIFNNKYELVGVVNKVRSSPFQIGTETTKSVPVLINKETREKVKMAPYHHKHTIPVLHQQGGVFVPITKEQIDGLFLARLKIAAERKKKEKK